MPFHTQTKMSLVFFLWQRFSQESYCEILKYRVNGFIAVIAISIILSPYGKIKYVKLPHKGSTVL